MGLTIRIRSVGTGIVYALYPVSDVPAGFMREAGRYQFEVELDGRPPGDTLLMVVNSMPIDLVLTAGRAFYPYDVGFHSGRLDLHLLHGGRLLFSTEIDVDPDQAKLTREDYALLVADMARATTALYRLNGLTIPAPTAATGARSALVLLELVRACFTDLEKAVRKVTEHPNRRLTAGTVRTVVYRARRADDRALVRAMRGRDVRAASGNELRAAPELVKALKGRWTPMLDLRRVHDEFDVYENRALLGFLIWLDGAVSNARRKLHADIEVTNAERIIWLDRTATWRRRLGVLRRSPVFHGLVADPALKSTSVFRLQPEYARVFTLMARIRSGLGVGGDLVPALPLERTFTLYEMWIYVRLLLAASELFPPCKVEVASLLRGLELPNALGTRLSGGTASSISLSDDITLTYQRRFGPTADLEGCRTSLIDSAPDITLSRVDATGRSLGLVLLDPKYRVGSSLLDGLRDLHVYRDAIRTLDEVPLTRAAVALTPQSFKPEGASLWNGAPSPGVMKVSPSSGADAFDDLLENAIGVLLRLGGGPNEDRDDTHTVIS